MVRATRSLAVTVATTGTPVTWHTSLAVRLRPSSATRMIPPGLGLSLASSVARAR
jgi:hypothetical protein